MQDHEPKLTIFFGDVDESVVAMAKAHDPSAWILNHNNYKEFLVSTRNQDTVLYTSLGDLPNNLEIVYQILSQAQKVVYCPPARWSDNKIVDFCDPGSSIQGCTEILLSLLPDSIEVENLDPAQPAARPLVDHRRSEDPQIWSSGCSITHGVGVRPDQRYAQLLADDLAMDCSFLTRPGSAIDWAADQILRSDIRANDLVIWGLTNPERLTYVHNHSLLKGVTSTSYQQFPEYKKIIDPSNLMSQDTIYKHFCAIQQVINFCKKIKARLVLVELLSGRHSLQRVLKSCDNYLQIPNIVKFNKSTLEYCFSDLGSDGEHPGPNQHQLYKKHILNHLNQKQILDQAYNS